MKSLFAAALLFASTCAFAEFKGPYLVKTNTPGYAPPEYQQSAVCEVFLTSVRTTKRFGSGEKSVQYVETHPVSVDGSLLKTIEAAAKEELKETGTICDAPGVRVSAYSFENAKAVEIPLLVHSSCSRDVKREGPATHVLNEFIDSICK